MIENKTSPDQVLIVGVHTNRYTDQTFDVLMDEMELLTSTAGGQVVQVVTQNLQHLNPRTAIGSGKVQELKAIIDQEMIDLVIFMNELSPSVNRHLGEELQVRVIDRVQLILDIFAMRAQSREGQLQVELAQYQYLLPRMHGRGIEMSRLGGGIGTRGPGETQLETDRRHIRRLIHTIEEDLVKLGDHRKRLRERRQASNIFTIGLIGYTNSGKSTLLNQLTEAETYVQDQLFATLDPLTRRMEIHGHDQFTITDTVGFIEELPTELIQAFKSTLEEMSEVDLLLHVVDASSPARILHEETVLELLEDLDMDHLPILTIYNKKDLLSQPFTPSLHPNLLVSAYNQEDVEKIKDQIWEMMSDLAVPYRAVIEPIDADQLARLRNETLVEDLSFDTEEEVYIVEGYRHKIYDENEE